MKTKIDKIKLTNIPVEDIEDMSRLRKESVIVKDSKAHNYMTGTGQAFTRLNINDNVIDKYVVGWIGDKPYSKMELSVKSKNGNLECNSIADTYEQMINAQAHLMQKYGVVTDSIDAKVSYIEINRTFQLKGRFKDYKRVITLMMSRLPKNKGVQIDFKNINGESYVLDEYVASNKSSAIKIYNKSLQMKMEVEHELMRVEITLKKSQSVKRAFGTNRIEDLTDEMIDSYFTSKMQEWFKEPLEKWRKNRDKKLLKLMEEMKQTEHHWVGSVIGSLQNEEILTGIPAVLDVDELLPVSDCIVLPKRKHRTREQFKKQSAKIYTAFNRKDSEKLEELLTNLCTTSNE